MAGLCVYQSLLQEGWIVATTSYRREDVIIKDSQAGRGVLELREYICVRYGSPPVIVVEPVKVKKPVSGKRKKDSLEGARE